MGKVQSHVKTVKDKVNEIFSEERKTELKRGLSYYHDRACIFKDIALLSKTQLLNAISELNFMLGKLCTTRSENVVFYCNPPDRFDWKKCVRIFCFQVDKNREDPVLTRYMNIIQFWTLRSEIIRQIDYKTEKAEKNQFQFVDSEGELISPDQVQEHPTSCHQGNGLCPTDILNRVNELSMEEVECCICMDKKSDVSLSCAHCFCKQCIESWTGRQRTDERTCPLCRQSIKTEDEYWEMTDVPDKDEMQNYVMSLASGI